MAFLFYTIIIILLGIFIRIFWVQIYILWLVLLYIIGILLSSVITAITFQFFTGMLTQGENWGSFITYFWYSLVFFIVAMTVYICIITDLVEIVVKFIREVLKIDSNS